MLSLPDRELLVNLFCEKTKDEEWTHIVSWNSEAFKRFEETVCLEDWLRSRRPLLAEDRITAVENTVNDLATESSTWLVVD